MHSRGRWDDPFGDTMAAADDQVILLQIELLNRCGKKRQIVPVMRPHKRGMLQEGSFNLVGLDLGGNGSGHMEQSKNGRVRVKIAETFQNLLPAPHSGEPIVYQSDFHRPIVLLFSPQKHKDAKNREVLQIFVILCVFEPWW